MKVTVIKPDGSLIFHWGIKGVAEADDGTLVLLQKTVPREPKYPKGQWAKFHAEREIVLDTTAETVVD